MKKVRVALCQMAIEKNKGKNIKKAEELIKDCADRGADMVVLPEMFNCPYDNTLFADYAEMYPNGETIKMLSESARREGIYIVGGSIPEKDQQGRLFNTSFSFDGKGELLGRHRKIHLFDIDVKGEIRFMESDVLSSGKDLTVFDTVFGKIGVAICYDIRFPELLRMMAIKGAGIIIIPAAFNMTTGPAHWECLHRVRAIDNQVYMLGVAPARDKKASYVSYGHSIITNPWGDIVKSLDEREDILIEDLDLEMVDKIREELPLLKNRRTDLYNLTYFSSKQNS